LNAIAVHAAECRRCLGRNKLVCQSAPRASDAGPVEAAGHVLLFAGAYSEGNRNGSKNCNNLASHVASKKSW